MASFYGGEQLKRFLTVTGTRTHNDGTGTSDLYTVPIGRYADVQFFSASGSHTRVASETYRGDGLIGNAALFTMSSSLQPSSANNKDTTQIFRLGEGQTVSLSTLNNASFSTFSITMTVNIKEYQKPN